MHVDIYEPLQTSSPSQLIAGGYAPNNYYILFSVPSVASTLLCQDNLYPEELQLHLHTLNKSNEVIHIKLQIRHTIQITGRSFAYFHQTGAKIICLANRPFQKVSFDSQGHPRTRTPSWSNLV